MNMNDVQQTLFFPLMGRADAARRWPDLFPDPWAEHAMGIREAEGSAAQQLGAFPSAVYGLRHLLTIREINAYLKDHPGAAVVNIGCGLDRVVHEIADADSLVYNVDFPEVIETRERWIEPHEREIALPYSATDHRWMDQVDAGKGLVAIAAGVFYYFEVEEVKALVREMGARFPGSRLCYDAESPRVTAGSEILHRHAPFVRVHQLYEEISGRCTSEGTLAKGSHAGKIIGAAQPRADRVRQVRDGWNLHVCDLGKDM